MKIVKNGVKHTGKQNFLCRSCGKQFQFHYQKADCWPETWRLVLHMLVRNCGIRDIEEVTGVHRQTVLRWLSQKAESLQVKPRLQGYKSVQLDEVWTFVGQRRKRKRWLFYSYAPKTDEVLAWSWETAASTRLEGVTGNCSHSTLAGCISITGPLSAKCCQPKSTWWERSSPEILRE